LRSGAVSVEAARPATPADLDRLVELARVAAEDLEEEKGGPLWTLREGRLEPVRESFGASLDADDHLLLVGTIDEVVFGFAAARWETLRDGTRHAVVDELYVEPEARGVAVGEALMDAVLAWCTEQGCAGVDAVALPGDRQTKNFFERYGLTARAIIVHRRLAS
jgi:ribosomal protein S18 acetylase RimI-like enzyme